MINETDKELYQFNIDIVEEVRNEAMINFTDPTTEFLNYYTEKLIEAEEILEFEEYDIEFVGRNRRKVKIDGFSYDSLERSISLFVADFNNDKNLFTLTSTSITNIRNRAIAFLDFVYDGFIMDNLEESSLAYQLAYEIMEKDKFINKIKIYILSNSKLSNYANNIPVDDFLDKKVEIIIWDIVRMNHLLLSSMQKEDLNINILDFAEEYIPCLKTIENDRYTCYLGAITGELLSNLYIKYGPRLLEGNVRSFLSVRGKINKGIRNTIRNDPEIFFVYNNGIACTATDIIIDEKENSVCLIKGITNFQIINGGQTTASIANAVLQDKALDKVRKISVPMKLTVINKNYFDEDKIEDDFLFSKTMTENEKKEAFVSSLTSNIARYANSQNKVDESDFFSNHAYHVRFETLARKTYAPPKNGELYETVWFYERAKGQYTQEQMKLSAAEKKKFAKKYPKNQVVKKIDLAKYLMTYYKYPYIVSKGNQFNMRIFAEKIDKQWKKDKNHTMFNTYYYKKCIALAILYKSTEKIVSSTDWYKRIKSYRANIVTYTLSSIFYMIENNVKGYELDFIKIWNQQGIYQELYDQINDLSYKVYELITAPSRSTENVTEWCKKEACWNGAERLMKNGDWELNRDFVQTLIEKDKNDELMHHEKKEQKDNDEIYSQMLVIKMTDAYWRKVLEWGKEMNLLNETEISFLQTAIDFSRRVPSAKQSKKILEINEKIKEEGFIPD